MKKFVAIMITAAMLLTLSVSAFAGTITTNGGSENRDVTGVFAQPTDKAIYVTVSWGDMKFKYTPDTQEWDHNQHIWKDGGTTGTWAPINTDGNKITVQNDSSCAVKAAFTYGAKAGYAEVNASFDKAELNLAAPTYNDSASHPSGTSNVSLSGSIDGDVAVDTVMGTITVTITA